MFSIKYKKNPIDYSKQGKKNMQTKIKDENSKLYMSKIPM